jgi:hypothetical protein
MDAYWTHATKQCAKLSQTAHVDEPMSDLSNNSTLTKPDIYKLKITKSQIVFQNSCILKSS